MKDKIPIIILAALTAATLAGCTSQNSQLSPTLPAPTSTPADSMEPSVTPSPALNSTFVLSSPGVVDSGTLSKEYTCDGNGSSPSLSWSNGPSGTKEFALMMTTLPSDGTIKWSWVLYGIPANTSGLAENSTGVGIAGISHRGNLAYEPPCSQGPGDKFYTFTLYALSKSPELPADDQVTGEVLTDAISSITISKATLNLSYARQIVENR